MNHRAYINDSGLRSVFYAVKEKISKVKMSKMIDCQGHLNVVLVSGQFIDDHSCVIDENIDVLVDCFYLFGKSLDGLFFR